MSLDDARTGKAPMRHVGLYYLIQRIEDDKLFRFSPKPGIDIPEGYVFVEKAYDEDGLLLPQFWALKRWNMGQDRPKEDLNEA